jgi:hypothetical protein
VAISAAIGREERPHLVELGDVFDLEQARRDLGRQREASGEAQAHEVLEHVAIPASALEDLRLRGNSAHLGDLVPQCVSEDRREHGVDGRAIDLDAPAEVVVAPRGHQAAHGVDDPTGLAEERLHELVLGDVDRRVRPRLLDVGGQVAL